MKMTAPTASEEGTARKKDWPIGMELAMRDTTAKKAKLLLLLMTNLVQVVVTVLPELETQLTAQVELSTQI